MNRPDSIRAMTPTKTPTHGFLIRTAILLVHPVKLHTLNNALTFLLVIYFIRTKLMYDNIHKMLVFIENLTKPFSRHATYKILIPFHITYIKTFSRFVTYAVYLIKISSSPNGDKSCQPLWLFIAQWA